MITIARKLTDVEIRNKLSKINVVIEEGLYLNSKSQLKCKCLICNNLWTSSWSNLYKLKSCPKCSHKNKALTLEYIKNKLNQINNNIELISKEYINNYTNLSFRCLVDGCEWEATWGNISRRPNCPKCSLENMKLIKRGKEPHNKLTIDEINLRIKELNSNLNVVQLGKKLEVECIKCGYVWVTTWDSLSNSHKCKCCSGMCYSGIDEIKNILHSINPHIKIISNIYKNNYTEMDVECVRCGEQWKAKFRNIRKNCRCKNCDISNNKKTTLSEYLRDCLIDWKVDSMEKCGYKCVITGNRFDDIHHPVSMSSIIKEIFEELEIEYKKHTMSYTIKELNKIKNVCLKLHNKYGLGYCVTKEVHKDFHMRYGYRNNTNEQFIEFIKNNKIK